MIIDFISRPLLLHKRVSVAFYRSTRNVSVDSTTEMFEVIHNNMAMDLAMAGNNKEEENQALALSCLCDTENIGLLHLQWRYIGHVLDRLFFIFYLIVLVLALIFLFPCPK